MASSDERLDQLESGPFGLGAPVQPGRVRLDGKRLVIVDYSTVSSTIVAAFLAEDPGRWTALLGSLLELGASAHAHASSQADLDRLGREVSRLEESLLFNSSALQQRMSSEVERNLSSLAERVEALVGADGTLCQLLDPAAPGGLARGVAEAVRAAAAAERSSLAALIDPSSPTSPLKSLGQGLRTLNEGLTQIRVEIAAAKAASAARDGEAARGTARGRTFERALLVALRAIAKVHGDIAEPVGDKGDGLSGSKVGDHLVTVPGPGAGTDATFVVESKTGRVTLTQMRRELAEARQRRGAAAGLGVWASEDSIPTGAGPLVELGPVDFGIVYDPASGDDEMLRVGYRLCRIVALAAARRMAMAGVDADALAADLAEAKERVAALFHLRGEVTRIGNAVTTGLDGLRTKITNHGDDLGTVLDRMELRLSDAPATLRPSVESDEAA